MISLQLAIYSLLFIITSGMASIGIILSYQLPGKGNRPEFQWLFYQQLLYDAFLIFVIWGYFTLNHLLGDIRIDSDLKNRILIFQPYIGLPFLMVSWLMLFRFIASLSAFTIPRWLSITWLAGCMLLLPVGVFFISEFSDIGNFHIQFFSILSVINSMIICVLYFWLIKKEKAEVLRNWKRFGFLHGFPLVTLISTAMILFLADKYPGLLPVVILSLFISGLLPVLHFHNLNRRAILFEEPFETGFDAFCKKYEITRREAEIILEICKGKSNRQISEELFITLQTVKDHIYRIYSKTGVNNRVQLTNLASLEKS